VSRPPVSYVLPLRWRDDDGLEELTDYLRAVCAHAEVIVVDGSGPELFAGHAAAWGPWVRHLAVDPDLSFAYGKVNGVITGVRAARHEAVVLADDDVRYEPEALARAVALLGAHALVRPQNYFDPVPWHARWDTARTLLNRALAADYPGTLAVRRSAFLAAGGYDGAALFENLELIRTLEAAGHRTVAPLDLYVRRVPPSAAHFRSQRVRQAYDSFAQPARLAGELLLGPLALVAAVRARRLLPAAVAATIALAELGRRRAGGARVFPATSSLLAPGWIAERAVCAWLALAARVRRGGVAYAGTVLGTAAHSPAELERRARTRGRPGPL
jgi:glycosyl transferase family 2